MDAKAGTTSNTIEGVYTVSYNRKTQERQQLSVEDARCCEISSRNERMGNTIDFHYSVLRDSTIAILRQLDDRQYTGNNRSRAGTEGLLRANRIVLDVVR